MNSTMRVVLGIGVVIVAVVLLVVLKSGDESRATGTTTAGGRQAGPITTIVVDQNGKPVGGIAEITLNEGEQVRFKVESAVGDEVHMHGYDIGKDVKAAARSPSTSRRRSKASSRPSSRAAKNRSSNYGSTRRSTTMNLIQALPSAHALVARQDLPIPAWLFAWGASIVLIVSFFALSAAWREPRFEERTLAPPRGGALAGPARPARADPLRRARRLPARRLRSTPGCTGTEAPDRNFAITFLFVTCWLGFPLFSVIFGNVFKPFNPWRAIGRAVGGALRGDRRAALRPPAATRERSAAGRPRSGWSPSSGWRSSTASAAGSRSALDPHAAGVAPSSTASTRWR